MTANEHPVISLRGVSKRFANRETSGFVAVDNIDLDVHAGEMVALLGKTGCGKSTIFNLIAGLTEPSQGVVKVNGLNPFTDFNLLRGGIAIVFQNDRLLPWRTAIANVDTGLEILGVPAAVRREKAQYWLSKLGLVGHEQDFPHALSGGMRQRVAIARAFATDAKILLCDEPFSALDEMTAARLRTEFVNLVKENGRTAIFITHSINEAMQIGDRIVVLKRPARIAEDIKIDRKNVLSDASDIRKKIEAVLAE
jgi:NitT/TauT family transport system ATP-binding protein